jgi:formylglycine-generating enzyme required for sulfatase activity
MDFELEIEPSAGESYQATVRQSPLGRQGRRARCTFNLPDLEDLNVGGPDLRHLSVDDSGRTKASIQDLGRRLFKSVFIGPVLAAWQASLAMAPRALTLRLLLADDARLLLVPWEILYDEDEGEFVATERCLIRSLDTSEARRLKWKTRLRVLAVLSCPPGVLPLQIEEEWAALQKTLDGVAELQRVPARLDQVGHALSSGRWDVLHFAGHGDVDPEGGYLILEGWDGDSWAVNHLRVKTFLAHPSLQLVVLNACVGGCPGSKDAFSGLAQALVRRGVPAIVAMQQPVSDRAAIAFSELFYRALAGKATVGKAVQQARKDLFRDQEAEWTVPVLYLNGTDEPLVRGRFWKRLLLAALMVVLIIALLGWARWLLAVFQDLKHPRGAEKNPPECASPLGLDMAFVRIDPVPFTMGDERMKESRPVHQVTITRPFCIGVYEVTQEQWDRVFQNSPSGRRERYQPVQGVKYDAAEDFVRLLNEKDPAHPYRLPTEAEWEYVARGGTRMIYSFMGDAAGLVDYANCVGREDGFDDLTWVGQFQANRLGVHDMYGNVFEWVSDWYAPYSEMPAEDPSGPSSGARRIRRGGSWRSGAEACSSAARSDVEPNRQSEETGFRIVREIR